MQRKKNEFFTKKQLILVPFVSLEFFKINGLTEFGNLDLTISFLAELPETLPFTGCKSENMRSYFGY